MHNKQQENGFIMKTEENVSQNPIDRYSIGETVLLNATVAYPGSRVSDFRIGNTTVQLPNEDFQSAILEKSTEIDDAMVTRACDAYEATPGAMYYKDQYEAMRSALTAAIVEPLHGKANTAENDWHAVHVLMTVMRLRPLTLDEQQELHNAHVNIRRAYTLTTP